MNVYDHKPTIGYMCSYIPHQFISELGFSMINFNDLDEGIGDITTKLPINLCSYSLHCARALEQGGIDGLIITNCCNNMQRLYDYVKLTKPDLFCYMLELPRDNSKEECMYFGRHITNLIDALTSYFHLDQNTRISALKDLSDETRSNSKIYVIGNTIPKNIIIHIERYLNNYDLDINQCRTKSNGDAIWQRYLNIKGNSMDTGELIPEQPCARMSHFINYFEKYIKYNKQLKGVVYISTKNCDYYLLDFPAVQELCKVNGIPVIELEINYNDKCSGQFETRLEAFIECLEFNKHKNYVSNTSKKAEIKNPFIQRMNLTRALIPKLPLKSIQMVVENQVELFTKTIWTNPKQIVWTNMVMTPELFYAAGLLPINMELVSGWLSSLHLSKDYISLSGGNGISSSICSYHKATLGLIEDGGLNHPLGAVVSSHICDGGVGVANYFKNRYGTDTFILNVPFIQNEINRGYLIEQYKSLLGWIENYTGKKLTDDKIKEALELSNETSKYWLKALELRKGIPVVPGRFALRNLFGATFLFGSQLGLNVVKAYYDELLEKSKKDNSVYKDNKRILWIHFAPLYNNNLLEYLEEELGCSIVFDITGHIYWDEYDTQKPLESLAERVLSHFYLGEAEKRKELYKRIIREYKIDGVIHMMHSGCRAIPGASWQVRDVANEMNISYLELSGDCIDPRGFSEEQMKLRLEAFKETIWRR